MALLRYVAKFDPMLSLDCAPHALHPGGGREEGRDQILTSGNLAMKVVSAGYITHHKKKEHFWGVFRSDKLSTCDLFYRVAYQV